MAGWAVLVLVMLVTLFPFYWMLRTSFSNTRALAAGAADLLPVDFTLGAYRRVLGLSSTAEAVAEAGRAAPSTSGSTCATRSSSPRSPRPGRSSSARWPPTPSPGCAGPAGTPSSRSSSPPSWCRRSSPRCPTSC
ncbi:N-Acetyl-D-glucosamine ABC transport system, permease protein 2 [[Actinomadura] parvosata subsp. kistnae]|nr:N-Acetyl-D-glucosamine ABC transport system, permease protein 2 [Actinomadura parvosata subsp. kistnae]